ncbi:MAG: 4-(cytidine 5'-diphospho)-2-C-methyl-D-erythritol kinase [Pseudomonadota bacterium]
MDAPFRAFAPAKVNLFLHVGAPRSDGRHPLDSLVVFAGREAADVLEARRASRDGLQVNGPYSDILVDEGSNLVLEALSRLRGQARIDTELDSQIAFSLQKNLPIAAGLGGGSADAAAALRLLTREIFDLPARVASDLAPQLGGDVLACVFNTPALMRGDGDEVLPLLQGPLLDLFDRRRGGGLPALLVNPGVACPTGPVFKHYDLSSPGELIELELPFLRTRPELYDWLASETRNDLEKPAIDLVPEIGSLLERMETLTGARLVRMSGSGATCFALFDDMEDALLAQSELLREAPNWWVRATRLGEGV